MQRNKHLLPFDLQSKHLICSEEYEEVLRECMEEMQVPEGQAKGREAFLKKRAGQVKTYQVVEMPELPMMDLSKVGAEWIDAEMMDFLQSPCSVQFLDVSNWVNVWKIVEEQHAGCVTVDEKDGKARVRCLACESGPAMSLTHMIPCGENNYNPCVDRYRCKVDEKSLLAALIACVRDTPPQSLHSKLMGYAERW